eukprot:TRINITY_DN6516_c0_g2_i1.p1 TRINITY_DN6516_c0_g2~~TRINITY_DN6516_c0_g2_i1.p1  ORF type:complete len:382 (-),score=69.70 TRINITY_DN6516_c0_g2_i1:539-1684(-)
MASVGSGRRNTSSVAGVLSEARAAATTRPTAPISSSTTPSTLLPSELPKQTKTTLPIIQKKPQSNAQSNAAASNALPSARQADQRVDLQEKPQGSSSVARVGLQSNRVQSSSITKPSPPSSSAANTRSTAQAAPPPRRAVLPNTKKDTSATSSSKISKNPSVMDLSSNEASSSQTPQSDLSLVRSAEQNASLNMRPTSSSATNQRKGRLGMLPTKKTPPETHAASNLDVGDPSTISNGSPATQVQQMSSFRRPVPPPSNTAPSIVPNPRRSAGKSTTTAPSASSLPPPSVPKQSQTQTLVQNGTHSSKAEVVQKEIAPSGEVKSDRKPKQKEPKINSLHSNPVADEELPLDFEIRPYCFDIVEYVQPTEEQEDSKIMWYCM